MYYTTFMFKIISHNQIGNMHIKIDICDTKIMQNSNGTHG